MRKLFFITLLIVCTCVWFSDFIESGRFEKYLDSHPNPDLNSQIEYYWAFILNKANHKVSAKYRYERVISKYPQTEIVPSAWIDLIEVLNDLGKRREAINECRRFLEKYESHPKAALVRIRITFLE